MRSRCCGSCWYGLQRRPLSDDQGPRVQPAKDRVQAMDMTVDEMSVTVRTFAP